ncbi:MAG: DUF3261 domain-containing protein [Psychromonas sp.]|nr:DUF3261 domain-containing protein [Psychromonas sp.]
MRIISYIILLLLVSSCSSFNVSHTDVLKAQVAPSLFIELPKPAQFNKSINVSQLLTIDRQGVPSKKLLVQLQVDPQHVVLAGFSSWGSRLLSVEYTGTNIKTYVMFGLSEQLPKPKQVLFNLMLAIWPIASLEAPLQKIGWKIQDTHLKRLLLDEQNHTVVKIVYQTKPVLKGDILFENIPLHYKIKIQTQQKESKA